MWLEIAAGGYLLEEYIRHKYFDDPPPKPKPANTIDLPRIDDGAPIPLLYGRCRVRSPWLAYTGIPQATPGNEVSFGEDAAFVYSMDMFYVLGIPFLGGSNHLHHIWVDDFQLNGGDLGVATGNGNFETPFMADSGALLGDRGFIGQSLEFLNGNSSQKLVEPAPPYTSHTFTGNKMITALGSGALIPGYRGYLSVFLYNGGGPQWYIGNSPSPGIYTFETSSYPGPGSRFGPSDRIGDDANPADVIHDLLVGRFGKLGLSNANVDAASFSAAGATLATEGTGYSRSIEDGREAGDVIVEILEQVTGILYEDPATDSIKMKLIRDDYDPDTMPLISPANCVELTNFAAGSRSNLPNKIRVVYTDRSRDYRENSATAHFLAQAAGQDNVVREVVLQRPGITTAAQAEAHAARELSARSRPTMKCRAVCSRSMVRVHPGDAVFLTWPEYGISEMVMRVAGVGRGTLDEDRIALDLIQDQSRARRGSVVSGTRIASFPTVVHP